MDSTEEAGASKVSASTREFELEDEQVFPGAGRGPTPGEAAAAERWGVASASTARAHAEMRRRGAHQRGEGRLNR